MTNGLRFISRRFLLSGFLADSIFHFWSLGEEKDFPGKLSYLIFLMHYKMPTVALNEWKKIPLKSSAKLIFQRRFRT